MAIRYACFISYSSRDRAVASWLLRALETYRLPRHLRLAGIDPTEWRRRLSPVFQDRAELTSSADLAESVRAALACSDTLIVICSPAAAASRWVNEEIRTFQALGKGHCIRCLVVDGEPLASRRPGLDPAHECFPEALIDGGREPLAADLRPAGDGRRNAKLKLIASLLGVSYDELRRRDATRRQHRLMALTVASLVGVAITSGLAVYAWLAERQAVEQRDIARQKTATAERTVAFVTSMFEQSDPSEAKGAQVTAREVLDRGANQIATSLGDEGAVKAEIMTTLAEVYVSLGLLRRGEDLAKRSLRVDGRDAATGPRQYRVLADAASKRGDYPTAIARYRHALALAQGTDAKGSATAAALAGLGEAQSSLGEYDAADATIRRALDLDMARVGKRHPDVARDWEALGLNAYFNGRPDEAARLTARALAIRVAAQGELHPRVADDLNLLGVIAHEAGRRTEAEAYYRRVLARDERVLGPNHPDLAGTLNNLGRVLLERRRYDQAGPLLQRAITISLSQRDADNDDMAFEFDNLGIVEAARGRSAAAETLFRRALAIAQAQKHRNTAPIMVDLGSLLCATGRGQEAQRLFATARPIMAAAYAGKAWRIAWLDNSLGACDVATGAQRNGMQRVARSSAAVLDRWPADTHYGSLVMDRQRQATRLATVSADGI